MALNRLLEVLSPSRRYHENKPFASLVLRLLDVALCLLPARSRQQAAVPQRILLMNAAYVGDNLMSTSVLPMLRARFPQAFIGVLVGSWARQVYAGHPMVDTVHTVDLARLNRARISRLAKWRQQWRTQSQARREMVAQRYDVAIDLFTGFPPLGWLAWQCGIARRIGYLNRGFGALLTDAVQLTVLPGRQEVAYHLDLIERLGASRNGVAEHPHLPEPQAAARQDVERALGWSPGAWPRYVVVHPGSGERLREWPEEKWRALLVRLGEQCPGLTVVMSGHGPRETALIDRISGGLDHCVSTCGKLSWAGLCALVRHAGALVGIESMSGHLASAWQVPTVTLMTGMADPQRWRPANARGIALHAAPACLPCMNRRGCEAMTCVRDIQVDDVLAAICKSMNVDAGCHA